MKKIKLFFRYALRVFLFSRKTDNFFYGKYQGGRKLTFLKKCLIVFLDLHSFIDYVLYNNNPVILRTIGKAQKIEKDILLKQNEKQLLSTLQKDGIVFLNGYYEKIVDQLAEENIQQNTNSTLTYIRNDEIKQNSALFEILNDKLIINIASKYYGVKSFFRYRPTASLTFPSRNDITSRVRFENQSKDYGNLADEWHVDSIYNLQYHILLKDVEKNDTRMLFAKGNKVEFFDRFAGYASEEYVRNNFEIIELFGKKGTVILFDGSCHWHRLLPVKGSKRYTSSVLFTRGQQPCSKSMYKERLIEDKLNSTNNDVFKFIV